MITVMRSTPITCTIAEISSKKEALKEKGWLTRFVKIDTDSNTATLYVHYIGLNVNNLAREILEEVKS